MEISSSSEFFGPDIGFLNGESTPQISDSADNISDVFSECEYQEYTSNFSCRLIQKPSREVDDSPYETAKIKSTIAESDLASF